jgi:hypothetical protein
VLRTAVKGLQPREHELAGVALTHKTGLARMASHHGRVDRRRGVGRYSPVSPGCCAFSPAAPLNRTVCNGPGAPCGPLPETTTALARSSSGYGRVGRHAVPHSPCG